eukprot:TRINITY_DN15486_c0_g1_i1.p1 TRINITY_DN15486_c0_g1~~TRINITY_DN15486_c0_g1_i1.p1  ORF type:complete len:137 (-),score=34.41 TRINITY_DN15486_c0_g1_i1:298-708(-)
MGVVISVVAVLVALAGGAVASWWWFKRADKEQKYAVVGADGGEGMFSIDEMGDDLDCETLQANLESKELELELLRASYEEKDRDYSQLRATSAARCKALERQVEQFKEREGKLQAALEARITELNALKQADISVEV